MWRSDLHHNQSQSFAPSGFFTDDNNVPPTKTTFGFSILMNDCFCFTAGNSIYWVSSCVYIIDSVSYSVWDGLLFSSSNWRDREKVCFVVVVLENIFLTIQKSKNTVSSQKKVEFQFFFRNKMICKWDSENYRSNCS